MISGWKKYFCASKLNSEYENVKKEQMHEMHYKWQVIN